MAAVREVTAHFDNARQREFRRFLVASALLHLGAFVLLTAVPNWTSTEPLRGRPIAAPRA